MAATLLRGGAAVAVPSANAAVDLWNTARSRRGQTILELHGNLRNHKFAVVVRARRAHECALGRPSGRGAFERQVVIEDLQPRQPCVAVSATQHHPAQHQRL